MSHRSIHHSGNRVQCFFCFALLWVLLHTICAYLSWYANQSIVVFSYPIFAHIKQNTKSDALCPLDNTVTLHSFLLVDSLTFLSPLGRFSSVTQQPLWHLYCLRIKSTWLKSSSAGHVLMTTGLKSSS